MDGMLTLTNIDRVELFDGKTVERVEFGHDAGTKRPVLVVLFTDATIMYVSPAADGGLELHGGEGATRDIVAGVGNA